MNFARSACARGRPRTSHWRSWSGPWPASLWSAERGLQRRGSIRNSTSPFAHVAAFRVHPALQHAWNARATSALRERGQAPDQVALQRSWPVAGSDVDFRRRHLSARRIPASNKRRSPARDNAKTGTARRRVDACGPTKKGQIRTGSIFVRDPDPGRKRGSVRKPEQTCRGGRVGRGSKRQPSPARRWQPRGEHRHVVVDRLHARRSRSRSSRSAGSRRRRWRAR